MIGWLVSQVAGSFAVVVGPKMWSVGAACFPNDMLGLCVDEGGRNVPSKGFRLQSMLMFDDMSFLNT